MSEGKRLVLYSIFVLLLMTFLSLGMLVVFDREHKNDAMIYQTQVGSMSSLMQTKVADYNRCINLPGSQFNFNSCSNMVNKNP